MFIKVYGIVVNRYVVGYFGDVSYDSVCNSVENRVGEK